MSSVYDMGGTPLWFATYLCLFKGEWEQYATHDDMITEPMMGIE